MRLPKRSFRDVAALAVVTALALPLAVIAAPCPGAVAWRQAHPEQSTEAILARDRARTLRDPELLATLRQRFDVDQDARHRWGADPNDKPGAARVSAVDRDNVAWLEQQMRAHGFPSVDQVGENGPVAAVPALRVACAYLAAGDLEDAYLALLTARDLLR